MEYVDPKLTILEFFLEWISRYKPLSSARLVTLGANGIEAGLWKKYGIPGENGWLIERSRIKSKNLIRETDYRYCNNLGMLRTVLQAQYGDAAVIDGIHFDFCGALEPNFQIFERLIPLTNNSEGRSLAITVADMRTNISPEDRENLVSQLQAIMPEETLRLLFNRLLTQQLRLPRTKRATLPLFMKTKPFDPVKATWRELSTFTYVMKAVLAHNCLPDQIARYVYISRYGGRAFRMRSYFIHLNGKTKSDFGPAEIAQLWTNSPLLFISKEGKIKEMKYEKLARLVSASDNAEVADQFQNLVSAANQGNELLDSLQRFVRQALESKNGQPGLPPADTAASKNPKPASQTGSAAPSADTAPSADKQTKRRGRRKGSKNLPKSEKRNLEAQKAVNLTIELLDAAIQGPEVYATVEEKVARELRILRKRNRRRITGGMLAQAKGKFRPAFMERVGTYFDRERIPGICATLAPIYSSLESKKVTAAQLAEQAMH